MLHVHAETPCNTTHTIRNRYLQYKYHLSTLVKEFRIAFEQGVHLSDLYRSTAVNDGYFSPSMAGLSFRSNYNIWRYCSLALSLRHLYFISPHLRVAIIFFKRWSVYSYGIILHSFNTYTGIMTGPDIIRPTHVVNMVTYLACLCISIVLTQFLSNTLYHLEINAPKLLQYTTLYSTFIGHIISYWNCKDISMAKSKTAVSPQFCTKPSIYSHHYRHRHYQYFLQQLTLSSWHWNMFYFF